MNAAELVSLLDRGVVAQPRAKRTIASAVVNHYNSLKYQGTTRIQKSNVLMIGETGVGKTWIIQSVARTLAVPFASVNATSITPSGWAGADPESVVVDLLKAARKMFPGAKDALAAARRGIVFIDEIDKLAQRGPVQMTAGATGGFSLVNVQQSLLKIIEGTVVQVSKDGTAMPTDNVLFVAAGAFVGLDQIVARREHSGKTVRNPDPPHIALRRVEPRDLIEYGFIPEFVGRFPVVATLDPLTENDLVAILRDVDDSLVSQMRARAQGGGADLDVDDGMLRNLARMALVRGTGARGLRGVLEKVLEGPSLDLVAGQTLHLTIQGVYKTDDGGVASEGTFVPSVVPFGVTDLGQPSGSEPTAAPAEGENIARVTM